MTLDFTPAAVLFDMDGLMIESERALLQCWREASQELGLQLEDALWLSFVGLSDRACHALLLECLGDEALLKEINAVIDDMVASGEIQTFVQKYSVGE